MLSKSMRTKDHHSMNKVIGEFGKEGQVSLNALGNEIKKLI